MHPTNLRLVDSEASKMTHAVCKDSLPPPPNGEIFTECGILITTKRVMNIPTGGIGCDECMQSEYYKTQNSKQKRYRKILAIQLPP